MQSRPSHLSRGYETVGIVENTEDSKKPIQDCVVAACGELPERIQFLHRAMVQ